MNYWKDIAAVFGLNLNEEFRIKRVSDNETQVSLYRFTDDGLEILGYWDETWVEDDDCTLEDLADGTFEVVES